MRCDLCGNDYDKTFQLIGADGVTRTFDSFECAIHAVAPTCEHCGCRIVGHGTESEGSMFCCAHCAGERGVSGARDRIDDAEDAVNAEELRQASVALDEPSG